MKWLYIYELPLGIYYGQQCLNFPERTVCFGNEMPSQIDLTYMNVSLNDVVSTACQEGAQWFLPRIQQPTQLASNNYNPYSTNSSDVAFVIMDTWVDSKHKLFGRRVQNWQAFQPHDPSKFPSHGTHCAGLIGSSLYGTARQSKIYSVQVLNDEGQGDYAALIEAVHYVYTKISQYPGKKFIVSMSISGPKSLAFNRAIETLTHFAPVFVAAGNEAQDACKASPSSAKGPMVVAASSPYNRLAVFSNNGPCVTLIAPGESILSLCPNNALCYQSGTSMATPLAAGLAAHYWVQFPHLTPNQLQSRIVKDSAWNIIKDVPPNTPNRFLYKPSQKCFTEIKFQE